MMTFRLHCSMTLLLYNDFDLSMIQLMINAMNIDAILKRKDEDKERRNESESFSLPLRT